MLAVYKRELRSYFCSMTGYIVIAVMLFFPAMLFVANNINSNLPRFDTYAFNSIWMAVGVIFSIAILTMKCFAEDRKSKTDQMLLTYPVSVRDIVLGKYLSLVTVIIIPVIVMCAYPMILSTQQDQYLVSEMWSIVAFFLMMCVFCAVGMFYSSLTENQIIAAVFTFITIAFFYMLTFLSELLPTTAAGSAIGIAIILVLLCLIVYLISRNWILTVGLLLVGATAEAVVYFAVDYTLFENLLPQVVASFNLTGVLNNFIYYQVLDIAGLVLYVSVAALFVFLTVQSVQKRRYN